MGIHITQIIGSAALLVVLGFDIFFLNTFSLLIGYKLLVTKSAAVVSYGL